jgi:hypothetical protein
MMHLISKISLYTALLVFFAQPCLSTILSLTDIEKFSFHGPAFKCGGLYMETQCKVTAGSEVNSTTFTVSICIYVGGT